jgi:signal peptidase I
MSLEVGRERGRMRELRLDDDAFVELAGEILRQGGSFQFRAHGSSMAPFVRDGDLLTVEPAGAAALEIGDVALYRTRQGRIVAHRLVGRAMQGGELLLETRGDARLASDRPAPRDCVLGRVVRVRRGDRVYRLDRGPWRQAARLWMRLLPLRRALARLASAVKGAGLFCLQGVQSAGPYRRWARRAVGARARYRPADARHAEGLGWLFGQETVPGIPEPAGAMARRLADGEGDGLALIATVGDGLAGGVALRRFPDGEPFYPGWWLLGPVVRARYRRAGIGAELLRQALEAAAAEGASWLHLLAIEDDAATRRLAQRAGFLPVSLPALQARLEEPAGWGERRRITLACALPVRRGFPPPRK